MKQKKFIVLMLTLVLVLVISGCSKNTVSNSDNAGKEDKIILKFGHTTSTDHAIQLSAELFAKRVSELTNGRVEVQIFPSGQLGGEKAQLESLIDGGHDFHMGTQAPLMNWTPKFAIFDLPYLVYSYEEADALLKSDVAADLLNGLPEIGLYGLGWAENGFRLITNNVRPIKSPEDFGGMLVRTMENKMMLDTFELWGCNPTPMAFTEVYTALQQGTVDGQENPASLIVANRFYEVQDYMSVSNHLYSPFIFYASKIKMDSLPEDIQEAIRTAAKEACEFEIEKVREQNEAAVKTIKDSGTEVYYLNEDEMQKFKDVSMPIYEEYRSVIGENIYDTTMELIEEIRK